MERRKYHRKRRTITVQFFEGSESQTQQNYHEGVIQNWCAGGMFISTEHPFPKGSIILMKFRLETETDPVLPIQVCAKVRWSQYHPHSQGMGIEFLNFEGIDGRDFKEWITNLLG